MALKSKHQYQNEEFSLYAHLVQYKAIEMALDHFFREVIEGNVPLANPNGDINSTPWWDMTIVAERVNRYSQPWCLLFEAVAHARERLGNQGIPLDRVQIDENLKATIHTRYGIEDITWEDGDDD